MAWLDEASIPLTYDERRIVDDSRFAVVRPDVREWNLQVRDVVLDDQGHQYRCASGICRCATWRSTTRVISTGARVESAGARRGARRPGSSVQGSSVQVREWNLQVRDVALDYQGHQYRCASGICRCATWRSTTRVISTGARVESAGARRGDRRPGSSVQVC